MNRELFSRRPMPHRVRSALAAELRTARANIPMQDRWTSLERAHVLSQPWPIAHVRIHASMLHLAIRQRDARELSGQIFRLVVAGPASMVRMYPAGNTGRARVPANQPMDIPEDLAELLNMAAR